MSNKFKRYKSNFSFKKIGLLLGALLLTIGLGSGMNNAFAGEDAGSSLINWFGAKRTVSEQEISGAITVEKDKLMGELKIALQEAKQSAEDELAKFTEEQKQIRTSELQKFAANLKANIEIDLTKEKEAIIAELDAEHKQAIEDLENPAAPINPTPKPGVEPEPAPEPGAEVKPEPTPEPELETQPVLPSESDTEPKPEPASEPETAPITEPTSE
ncbi:hypothetical protein MKY15_04245 [Sporosarcina sp. FSL K6-1540]|uniref:hypothetical protein n=1 Tax=Sporosarcina sp. FSL K6-1540 TaxID=2921555 RepID=UPI00315AD20A